jgi:transcriptional regulator with XRE-family HTH domain
MSVEFLQQMGARIRQRRRMLHLSQEEVARRMPGVINGQRISLWERGLHRPQDENLEALAEVLEVSVGWLQWGREPAVEEEPVWVSRLEDRLAQAASERDTRATTIEELLRRQSEILERIEAIVQAFPTDRETEQLLAIARGEVQPVQPAQPEDGGAVPAKQRRRRGAR